MFIKPSVYYLDFCVSISEESRLLTVFFGLAGVSDPSVGNFEALRLAHFWLVVGSPRVKIFPNFRGGSIEKCLSCHQLATWVMKLWTTTWYCGTMSPLHHDGAYECLKKKCYLITLYVRIWSISPPLKEKKEKLHKQKELQSYNLLFISFSERKT